MASAILLGASLLVITMVTPGMGHSNWGPPCRIVNTTNEEVLQSTPCPFSDLDDPPYICVNSSRANSRSGFSGYRGGGYRGRWRSSGQNLPPTRRDYCQLNLNLTEGRCTQDSDCKSYPGLIETRCYSRSGRCYAEFNPAASIVVNTKPCEISVGGGGPIYTAVDPCSKRGGSRHRFNTGSTQPTYECPRDAQVTATTNSRTYRLKLCVKVVEQNNNNNNVDSIPGNP